MKPNLKLNGGNPVVICNKCSVIINYLYFFDKIKMAYPRYCRECDEELNRKFYNNKENETK